MGNVSRKALDACRSTIGARVVHAFQRSVGMQHHGARMAHGVRIGIRQYLDIVAGRHQAVDQAFIETGFEPQIGMRRAPGAPEQPARPVDGLFERLAGVRVESGEAAPGADG